MELITQIAGVFNILVGVMLVTAILMFFGGLGMWFTRLGTYPTYRDDAIEYMKWAVVILFVLAALLALIQFVQNNAALASFAVGVAIVGAVAWLIVKTTQEAGGGEDGGH